MEDNVLLITYAENHFKELGWPEDRFITPKEVLEKVSQIDILGLDTETSGLGSYLDTHTYCVAIGDAYTQYVIVTGFWKDGVYQDDRAIMDEFKDLFNYYGKQKDKLWVMHNVAFDLPRMMGFGYPLRRVHCSLRCERQIQNGYIDRSAALDATLNRHLGIKLSKEERVNIAEVGLDSVAKIEYAGKDTKYLPELYKKQKWAMEQMGMIKDMYLHNEYEVVNAYQEFVGTGINEDRLDRFVRDIEHEEWSYMRKIEKIAEEGWPEEPPTVWTRAYKDKEFPKTLKGYVLQSKLGYLRWTAAETIYIFKALGINTHDKKERRDSVAITFITKRQNDHDIVKPYIKYVKAKKLGNTYGREFKRHIKDDGRIHTRNNPFVETGRTSSGNTKRLGNGFVNMQNPPNNAEFRACFTAKGQSVLVGADFPGQEAQMLADISGEKRMIKFFQDGAGDMHSWVAQQMYPEIPNDLSLIEVKEQFPELRRRAKEATFTLQYNGSHFTLANKLNIPDHIAKGIYDNYFRLFPGIKDFHRYQIAFSWEKGYMRCCRMTKRKRFIPEAKSIEDGAYQGSDEDFRRLKSHVANQSCNGLIQGSAATMTKTAMILIFRWIMENRKFNKIKIVLQIHDEIVLEGHPNYKEEMATQLKFCMETAWTMCMETLTTCEVKTWEKKYYIK